MNLLSRSVSGSCRTGRLARTLTPVGLALSLPLLVVGSLWLAATGLDTDEGHGAPGHDCGLEAKALQVCFQNAVDRARGARLETIELAGPVPTVAVRGRVNVGLEPGGDAAALARGQGLTVERQLPGLATLAGAGDRVLEACRALARQPGVRFAEPDYVAKAAKIPQDPLLGLAKGVRKLPLQKAWEITTGLPSIVVGVLDTGVDLTHKDLAAHLVPGWDFVNNRADAQDDNGHGTSVAGIVGALGDNNEGSAGVAFDARLMPIKVADGSGTASVADVAAGLDYAVAHGARIVNISLGTRVPSKALADAVARTLAANVLVVAAAGNDPVHVACYPAAYPGVVSVTSLSDDGELAYAGVVAPSVTVGAPGEDVIAPLPGNVYGFISGSSAAAGFASGVAALCLSKTPSLGAADLAQCLRWGSTSIKALEPLRGLVRFGALDPEKALARAVAGRVDLAVTDLRSYPAKPIPGQAVRYVAEVTNVGLATATSVVTRVRFTAGPAAGTLVGTRVIPTLARGDRTEVLFDTTAPASGTHTLEASTDNAPGEVDLGDNRLSLPLVVSTAAVADLRVVERTASDLDLTTGTVTLGMTVENRGTSAAANVVLDLSALGTSVAKTTVTSLAVGARATHTAAWKVPTPLPTGIVSVSARAQALPGETATDDNEAVLDLYVGGTAALRGLYQQSNGVDLIPDAPWRIDPNRSWLPVQVFVPSKGSTAPLAKLRIDRCTIKVRDQADGTSGAVVYDHAFGQAPQATSGLVLVDEMGQVKAGPKALHLFGSEELPENGRHEIVRVPRTAFGVPAQPAAPVKKFTDVSLAWTYSTRLFFFSPVQTRAGSHRAVMRTVFASAGMPKLPGDNHHHDVHHHTVAEWFFGSQLNVFAPRKAYGGPIQMIKESAYAMGVTDVLDDIRGKVIATDHNCFYNETIPNPNGPDYRVPFGPTSITAQPGTTNKQAFETIFGITSGEEVAYKQDIPISKFTSMVPTVLSNLLPGLPMGGHMLTYRAEHVEGPWHGGGWLKGPGNPNINVDLFPLLDRLAHQNAPKNAGSFTYAAHPFSGQGWNDGNMDRAFGLVPALRTREAVHDGTNKFVVKGLEFFNGRNTRDLDAKKIDFNDLNPWADPAFAAGVTGWDGAVQGGVATWFDMQSKTLDYAFTTDPDTKFIRKIYVAGGSDAHGDFNYSVARLATPLSIQATFSVGDGAYYDARTYCLGDGKPGATPQERWLQAYEDGNSLLTDGPLVTFGMDADTHWDATNQRWHAATTHEDDDGKIGGGGAYDGERTMLVQRGGRDLSFRYRYTGTPEFGSNGGALATLKIYKTELGNPNPTRKRGNTTVPVGRGALALAGADKDLVQPLDPAREGTFTKLGFVSLGAFTGGDPDVVDLGPDEYRCYTNPIYAIPYDAVVTVGTADAQGNLPAGALKLVLTFDASMSPSLYSAAVKAVSAAGETTGKGQPSLAALRPVGGQNGWTDRPGVKTSVLTLENAAPVTLKNDEFPAGSGKTTLVLAFADRLKDAAGNALHSIAVTATAPRNGAAGTVAPPSTVPGTTLPSSGRGGGGGGGCALATSEGLEHGAGPLALLPLVLALAVLVASRSRRA